MKLKEIETVEQFADYVIGTEYQDEFKDYKEWCDAVEPVIARLQGEYIVKVFISMVNHNILNGNTVRLYRSQTDDSIARDGYGMHWTTSKDDTLGKANLMMDFDLRLPHIAFSNGLDVLVEFVIPQSSLAKCTIVNVN